MKKRILALILSLSLLLSVSAPGTLAVSHDESGTISTFQSGTLTCSAEEHTHDETCRSAEPSCGLTETGGHTHGESCGTEQKLVCGLEEAAGHAHSAEIQCYGEPALVCTVTEDHTHNDGCYETKTELKCTNEAEEHNHDESTCYGPVTELACGLAEDETHTHGDGCYTPKKNLICTIPEDHTHGDGCYEENIICATPVSEGHSHAEGCYETVYLCSQEEMAGHSHTQDCYPLTCGKSEHQHTDGCYTVQETTVPETTTATEETRQELSFLEQLLAAQTLQEMADLINENTQAALALTADQVDSLENKANELQSTAPNKEAYENVMASVEAIRRENGYADCTCGTLTAEHEVDCPKFVTPEMGEFGTVTLIYLGGQRLETETYYYVSNGQLVASATNPGDRYAYVNDAYTLTLHNFSFSGCWKNPYLDGTGFNFYSVLSFPGYAYTIILEGENELTAAIDKDQTLAGRWYGAITQNLNNPGTSNITITGAGTLHANSCDVRTDVAATSCGFYVSGLILDTGTTLYINTGDGHMCRGLSFNSSCTIREGAELHVETGNATGHSNGAIVSDSQAKPALVIDGGAVYAQSGTTTAAPSPNSGTQDYGMSFGISVSGFQIKGEGLLYATADEGSNGSNGIRTLANAYEIDVDGGSVVVASGKTQAINPPATGLENALLIQNKVGEVTGNVTLHYDLNITEDMSLTITEGANLTVKEGIDLTIGGEVTNEGTLTNNGTVTVEPSGSYADNGSREGNGVLIVDGDMSQNDKDVILAGNLLDNALLGDDHVHIIVNVSYFDENAQRTGPRKAVVLRESMLEQDADGKWFLPPGSYGWYYVNGVLDIEKRFYVQNSDSGVETKIILGNNSTMNAKHGIDVSESDEDIQAQKWTNSLNIYQEAAPTDGTAYTVGILNATGTSRENGDAFDTAGIGGGDWRYNNSGKINICGGVINVKGAANCANIGSGRNGTVGPIVIKNAKVTSGNAGQAASIGAGNGGSLTTFPPNVINIQIENSIVLATSDKTHNGIGDDTDDSGTMQVKSSIIFTDKIGPKDATYDNSLLFLNETGEGIEEGNYGHYHGTLKDADSNATVTLGLPLVIPESATLTIGEDETFSYDASQSGLFSNAKFVNNGKIYRDWNSTFNQTNLGASRSPGNQVYQIVNNLTSTGTNKMTDQQIVDSNATGVEIFQGKLYADDGVTVTVTATSSSRLDMTVNTDGGIAVTVTAGSTENVQTFVMTADPVKLDGQVLEHFDLTITTTGTNSADPDHSWIFTVENAEKGICLTVVLKENETRTIKNLPYGTYTVTEQSGWSWRYGDVASQDGSPENHELTFTFNRSSIYWLDGYAWKKKED